VETVTEIYTEFKLISHDNKIFVIENFITAEECSVLLSNFNEATFDIPDPHIKSGYSISGEEAVKYYYSNSDDIEHRIFKKIGLVLSNFYNNEIEIKSMFHSLMLPGSKNPLHWDNYVDDGEEDISTLLYLNDDFEGGNLSFPDQNIKIKPEPGMLVFFRGSEDLTHEVETVESGHREALVGFCWPKSKRLSISIH
jgi:Rps23 Pro-64 3,4-dihydroxylase Tpa1-like proline 4-hydroxylase